MTRFSPVVERLLAASILCLAFVLMASVFGPRGSRAVSGDEPAAPSTDPHDGLRSLGELRSTKYIVRIYAGDLEPVYSIYDHDGNELAALLRAQQVDRLIDDVELHDLIAGARDGEYLMLAEPDDPR